MDFDVVLGCVFQRKAGPNAWPTFAAGTCWFFLPNQRLEGMCPMENSVHKAIFDNTLAED